MASPKDKELGLINHLDNKAVESNSLRAVIENTHRPFAATVALRAKS